MSSRNGSSTANLGASSPVSQHRDLALSSASPDGDEVHCLEHDSEGDGGFVFDIHDTVMLQPFMPNEIWQYILTMLRWQDILALARTSYLFRELVTRNLNSDWLGQVFGNIAFGVEVDVGWDSCNLLLNFLEHSDIDILALASLRLLWRLEWRPTIPVAVLFFNLILRAPNLQRLWIGRLPASALLLSRLLPTPSFTAHPRGYLCTLVELSLDLDLDSSTDTWFPTLRNILRHLECMPQLKTLFVKNLVPEQGGPFGTAAFVPWTANLTSLTSLTIWPSFNIGYPVEAFDFDGLRNHAPALRSLCLIDFRVRFPVLASVDLSEFRCLKEIYWELAMNTLMPCLPRSVEKLVVQHNLPGFALGDLGWQVAELPNLRVLSVDIDSNTVSGTWLKDVIQRSGFKLEDLIFNACQGDAVWQLDVIGALYGRDCLEKLKTASIVLKGCDTAAQSDALIQLMSSTADVRVAVLGCSAVQQRRLYYRFLGSEQIEKFVKHVRFEKDPEFDTAQYVAWSLSNSEQEQRHVSYVPVTIPHTVMPMLNK